MWKEKNKRKNDCGISVDSVLYCRRGPGSVHAVIPVAWKISESIVSEKEQ